MSPPEDTSPPSQTGWIALQADRKRIPFLGGVFAGAYTALHLEKQLASSPEMEIVRVSPENFVLFKPLLHEVAGSDVAITDIVQPLLKMLRRSRVAIVWTRDLFFSKNIVQLPTLRSAAISQEEDEVSSVVAPPLTIKTEPQI